LRGLDKIRQRLRLLDKNKSSESWDSINLNLIFTFQRVIYEHTNRNRH
jgi:hypothetical protein